MSNSYVMQNIIDYVKKTLRVLRLGFSVEVVKGSPWKSWHLACVLVDWQDLDMQM